MILVGLGVLIMDISGLYARATQLFRAVARAGHGIDHALRVARLAQYIAKHEGYDPQEAEIAGLLHDLGRIVQEEDKGHGPAGVPLASDLLNKHTNYNQATKERILTAVRDHSAFKANGTLTHIVQDSDKLDGLGAIGVTRVISHRPQLPLYDTDDLLPTKASISTTQQAHFVWVLEWVDMMETKTGRALAEKRAAFTQKFMRQIAREANGEDFLI